MTNAYWEHFEHEADIGVRGYGETLEQAFEQTALAMSSVITDLKSIQSSECVEIECTAPDYEVLLVDWLNELVFQMATRRMLFSTFKVVIHDQTLKATICGEPASQFRHQPAVEVKGATFTELKVQQENNGTWMAQCVVDV
jgi:tRNA nucleotidyltransferase (CCA-adding enzyme)